MSDRIRLKAQNHPPKLRTEYEEDELTDYWFELTPPSYPPSRKTRNSFFSQSSHRSAQLNTNSPVLSPDGASIVFNYAQPGNNRETGQTYPCHVTQPSPISWLPPETHFQFSAMPHSSISQGTSPSLPRENDLEHPIGANSISYRPPWATDRHSTKPQPVSPSNNVQFSAMPESNSRGTSPPVTRLSAHKRKLRAQQPKSCMPATDSHSTTPQPVSSSTDRQSAHSITQRTPRGVLRLSAHKRAIRAQTKSCVPDRATDKHATTRQPVYPSTQFSAIPHSTYLGNSSPIPSNVPQPVSAGVGCSASQVADHSLPQGINETHAQHAATSESWPQVTIRRSDPNRKMTPAEAYAYVYFSPEWKIYETIRQNGIYKGRTEYFYYNLVLPKQFRSLKSAEEYIRTKKIPNFMRGDRCKKQKADITVAKRKS